MKMMLEMLSGNFIRLQGDRRGVAAVEFGILAIPFFLILFFDFQLATMVILRTRLEAISDDSARLIMVDRRRDLTAQKFKERFVCPVLTSLISCDRVWIRAIAMSAQQGLSKDNRVMRAPDLEDKTWCVEGASKYVFFQVGFEVPAMFGFFRVPGMENAHRGDKAIYAVWESTQIRNEPTGYVTC